jgi:hypothetical protein
MWSNYLPPEELIVGRHLARQVKRSDGNIVWARLSEPRFVELIRNGPPDVLELQLQIDCLANSNSYSRQSISSPSTLGMLRVYPYEYQTIADMFSQKFPLQLYTSMASTLRCIIQCMRSLPVSSSPCLCSLGANNSPDELDKSANNSYNPQTTPLTPASSFKGW